MKPDWKDAPEWAHYLARDKSGDWFWYDAAPWCNNNRCVEQWLAPGRVQLASRPESNWEESLEARP